jgi:chromosome segregation ATPase
MLLLLSSVWRLPQARVVLAAVLLTIDWASAGAQTQRSGGGASAQLAQQYQQAAAEKSALATENANLKKELEQARSALAATAKERDQIKGKVGSAATEAERARNAQRATEEALAKSKENLDTLLAKAREIARQLATVEMERGQLQDQFASTKRDLDVCAERNAQLYDVNSEILDHFEHQSAFARMATIESFTRIKRNQLEDLVDGYRDRANELRLQRAGSAAHGAAPAPVIVPPPPTSPTPVIVPSPPDSH